MYKLLIVDDEEIEINAFSLMVGRNFNNISLLSANNGVEAMQIALSEKPDIIFMDIEMPGIDGLTVIEELKSKIPELCLIVHTAYSSFEYAQKAVKVGADDYLTKPVKMQTLIGVIRESICDVEERRSRAIEARQFAIKLAEFKPFIEKDIISSVSNGVEGKEVILQYATMFDLQINQVFCAIFKIDSLRDDSLPEDLEKTLNRKKEIAFEIVETLKQICQCIASEYISGSVLAIIPFEKNLSEYDIRIWAVQLATFVCNKIKHIADVKVGIGGLTTLEDIQTSYYEAYRTMVDTSLDILVKHHDDFIRRTEDLKDIRHYEFETSKMIIAGDKGRAADLTEKLFALLVIQYKAIEELKTKLLEICFAIKKHIEENTIEGSSISFGGDPEKFFGLTNYDAMKSWLSDFVNNTADQVAKMSGNNSSGIIRDAKIYIEENYDKEISLESVSASVCVTPYYLSRLFKKETGENFSAYLTQFRIFKSKALLYSTDKSIKAIANETGFNSQAYFHRVFKKIEGVSPSDFIEKNRKG